MGLMNLLKMGRSLNEVKSVGRYHVPRELGTPVFKFAKPAQKFSNTAGAPVVENAAAETVPVEVKKKTSGGWLKAANPFATAQRADGSVAAGAAQSELSLDKIKVVRNDLADADVEIVRQRGLPRQVDIKPFRKRNRPADVPAGDVLGEKAWGWLGSRLFGAAAKH